MGSLAIGFVSLGLSALFWGLAGLPHALAHAPATNTGEVTLPNYSTWSYFNVMQGNSQDHQLPRLLQTPQLPGWASTPPRTTKRPAQGGVQRGKARARAGAHAALSLFWRAWRGRGAPLSARWRACATRARARAHPTLLRRAAVPMPRLPGCAPAAAARPPPVQPHRVSCFTPLPDQALRAHVPFTQGLHLRHAHMHTPAGFLSLPSCLIR